MARTGSATPPELGTNPSCRAASLLTKAMRGIEIEAYFVDFAGVWQVELVEEWRVRAVSFAGVTSLLLASQSSRSTLDERREDL